MIEIDNQTINLLDEDWKLLIILDACRYDIFRDEYHILHKSKTLRKTKTHCIGTYEWYNNNIVNQDCSDIIYIDPIVMFKHIVPDNTFHEVVEVWKEHWNYEYGTILPDSMTDVTLQKLKQHPSKRFIVHYHQPHPPYLQPKFKGIDGPVDKPEEILRQAGKKRKFIFNQFFQGRLRKTIGCKHAWDFIINLGIEPNDYYGKIYKLNGMKGLEYGYRETLKQAFHSVNTLIDTVPEKIIITSDHSKNLDGSNKNLREQYVPWLEVE